jgi:hypothetical protein
MNLAIEPDVYTTLAPRRPLDGEELPNYAQAH